MGCCSMIKSISSNLNALKIGIIILLVTQIATMSIAQLRLNDTINHFLIHANHQFSMSTSRVYHTLVALNNSMQNILNSPQELLHEEHERALFYFRYLNIIKHEMLELFENHPAINRHLYPGDFRLQTYHFRNRPTRELMNDWISFHNDYRWRVAEWNTTINGIHIWLSQTSITDTPVS